MIISDSVQSGKPATPIFFAIKTRVFFATAVGKFPTYAPTHRGGAPWSGLRAWTATTPQVAASASSPHHRREFSPVPENPIPCFGAPKKFRQSGRFFENLENLGGEAADADVGVGVGDGVGAGDVLLKNFPHADFFLFPPFADLPDSVPSRPLVPISTNSV